MSLLRRLWADAIKMDISLIFIAVTTFGLLTLYAYFWQFASLFLWWKYGIKCRIRRARFWNLNDITLAVGNNLLLELSSVSFRMNLFRKNWLVASIDGAKIDHLITGAVLYAAPLVEDQKICNNSGKSQSFLKWLSFITKHCQLSLSNVDYMVVQPGIPFLFVCNISMLSFKKGHPCSVDRFRSVINFKSFSVNVYSAKWTSFDRDSTEPSFAVAKFDAVISLDLLTNILNELSVLEMNIGTDELVVHIIDENVFAVNHFWKSNMPPLQENIPSFNFVPLFRTLPQKVSLHMGCFCLSPFKDYNRFDLINVDLHFSILCPYCFCNACTVPPFDCSLSIDLIKQYSNTVEFSRLLDQFVLNLNLSTVTNSFQISAHKINAMTEFDFVRGVYTWFNNFEPPSILKSKSGASMQMVISPSSRWNVGISINKCEIHIFHPVCSVILVGFRRFSLEHQLSHDINSSSLLDFKVSFRTYYMCADSNRWFGCSQKTHFINTFLFAKDCNVKSEISNAHASLCNRTAVACIATLHAEMNIAFLPFVRDLAELFLPKQIEKQTKSSEKLSNTDFNIVCDSLAVFICHPNGASAFAVTENFVVRRLFGNFSATAKEVKGFYDVFFSAGDNVKAQLNLNQEPNVFFCQEILLQQDIQKWNLVSTHEIIFLWSPELHKLFFETKFQFLNNGFARFVPVAHSNTSQQQQQQLTFNLIFEAKCTIQLQMSSSHFISCVMSSIAMTVTSLYTKLTMSNFYLLGNGQSLFFLERLEYVKIPKDVHLSMERRSLQIDNDSHEACVIAITGWSVYFPYEFEFAELWATFVSIRKWNSSFKENETKHDGSSLHRDLRITIKDFVLMFEDDPFEIKLISNYLLMADEQREIQEREAELKLRLNAEKAHKHVPENFEAQLMSNLIEMNSKIYIDRSKKHYQKQNHSQFFVWKMEDFCLSMINDPKWHGKENILSFINTIDSEAPNINADDFTFLSLWSRYVILNVSKVTLRFRDFPLPLMIIEDGHVWGKLASAIYVPSSHLPNCSLSKFVELKYPWKNEEVQTVIAPRKYFHDFSSEVRNFKIAFGPCWEGCMAQLNIHLKRVLQPHRDPSPTLPWWDKSRFIFRGRFTVVTEKMSWIYHVSLNPYNVSEEMEWVWSKLYLDWRTANLLFRGSLNVKARMKSKYDDCCMILFHSVKLIITLNWITLKDCNDHHSVVLWNPKNIKNCECCAGEVNAHDAYRNFRSSNLDLTFEFIYDEHPTNSIAESGLQNPQAGPTCTLYASTLRFCNRVLKFLLSVARPIRSGPLFKKERKMKVLLTRHCREVKLICRFPTLHLKYWNSFACQAGLEGCFHQFHFNALYHLNLVPWDDKLKRRLKVKWSLKNSNLKMSDCMVYLITTEGAVDEDIDNLGRVLLTSRDRNGPNNNQRFFMSVGEIEYKHLGSEYNSSLPVDSDMPLCQVNIDDLKALWDDINRDVALGLFETYMRNRVIRRCLSSRILKDELFDNVDGLSPSQQSMSTPNTHNPNFDEDDELETACANSNLTDLLDKLITDSEKSSTAFTEEGGGSTFELYGVKLCGTEDILRKTINIELCNSQIAMRGNSDVNGYMTLTFAKATFLNCMHMPVWKHEHLLNKYTWRGTITYLQYFGTLLQNSFDQDITWLPESLILPISEARTVAGSSICMQNLKGEPVQILTVIERCGCDIFLASFEPFVDSESSFDVISAVADRKFKTGKVQSPVLENKIDIIDTLTVMHHDLKVHTNSEIYNMILGVINNLLFYIRPKKKSSEEKLKISMEAQLCNNEDVFINKILKLKEKVREKLSDTRFCEKELFYLMRTKSQTAEGNEKFSINQLKAHYSNNKKQLNALSEKLSLYMSVFKELRLMKRTKLKFAGKRDVDIEPCRRFEIHGRSAEWTLALDEMGQLKCATVHLRNILYRKVFFENTTDEHLFQVGTCTIFNCLPGEIYTCVLAPLSPSKQEMFRVYCKDSIPVGGIAVKEHFEVNVSPIIIQLTQRFFHEVINFFFYTREQNSLMHTSKGLKEDDNDAESIFSDNIQSCRRVSTLQIDFDSCALDEMSKRAAKNNMFLYVKIPEVPIRVSYKSFSRQKLLDLHEKTLIFPTLEYTNKTWTWHDLVMAVKSDVKNVLLSQAIKQKLGIRRPQFKDDIECMTEDQKNEMKMRMILGSKLVPEKAKKKLNFSRITN